MSLLLLYEPLVNICLWNIFNARIVDIDPSYFVKTTRLRQILELTTKTKTFGENGKRIIIIKVCGVKLKSYSWVAIGVIIFQNPKLKSHQSYYFHQAWEGVSLHLWTTFQLNISLRLKTGSRKRRQNPTCCKNVYFPVKRIQVIPLGSVQSVFQFYKG